MSDILISRGYTIHMTSLLQLIWITWLMQCLPSFFTVTSFLFSLSLPILYCLQPTLQIRRIVSLLLRRCLYKNYVKFFCMRDLSVLHLFTYSVIYLYHYELILIILWVTILCYYYVLLRLLFDSFFCLLLQSTPVSLDVPPYFVNITRWSWLIWCITVLAIWEFVTIKEKKPNYCHRHVARALAEQILKHPVEVHWISWLLRNMWPKGDERFLKKMKFSSYKYHETAWEMGDSI